VHTPHVIWSIINTKQIDQNSNKLILLNYPGPNLIKSLDKINNNLFELNDAYFLSDKFSEIKNLKILDTLNNNKKVSFVINIYTIDKFRNKKNIKTLEVKDKFDIRSKINLDMNLKNLNLTEKKLYFEIKDNNNRNLDNLKIKIILKNKYTLENFKIINKIDNCYYLEQV
jgi:hypothetical protein